MRPNASACWSPRTGHPQPPTYYITERFKGSEGQEQRSINRKLYPTQDRDNMLRAMQLMGAVQPQETAKVGKEHTYMNEKMEEIKRLMEARVPRRGD